MNGGLVACAALSLWVAACGGTSPAIAPTTPTPPEPRAVLAIGTGGATPALGIAGYSAMLFDATGSIGEGLSYRLEFGDGAVAVTSRTTHVPAIPQTPTILDRYVARLTVTDRLGRTDTMTDEYFMARLRFPVFGFWVNWVFKGPEVYRYDFRVLDFKSAGSPFNGIYTGPEGRDRVFTGTLSGERDVYLRMDDGTIEMTGAVGWSSGRVTLRLRVRGGLVDGQELEFTFDDIYSRN